LDPVIKLGGKVPIWTLCERNVLRQPFAIEQSSGRDRLNLHGVNDLKPASP
jgi:hypothetical protein